MSKVFALLALLALLAGPVAEAQHSHDTGDITAECLLCQKSSDEKALGEPLLRAAESTTNDRFSLVTVAAKVGFIANTQARGPPAHS